MRMKLEQKSVVSEGVYYSIVVDKKKGQGTFLRVLKRDLEVL